MLDFLKSLEKLAKTPAMKKQMRDIVTDNKRIGLGQPMREYQARRLGDALGLSLMEREALVKRLTGK